MQFYLHIYIRVLFTNLFYLCENTILYQKFIHIYMYSQNVMQIYSGFFYLFFNVFCLNIIDAIDVGLILSLRLSLLRLSSR